jgi:hypothetical protein
MKRFVWRIGIVLRALGSPAIGQTPDGRIQALGLVPAYIKANPAAVTKAFSKQLADKIFSDAYTSVRRQAVGRSAQSIPGYQCPSDPQMVLRWIPMRPRGARYHGLNNLRSCASSARSAISSWSSTVTIFGPSRCCRVQARLTRCCSVMQCRT